MFFVVFCLSLFTPLPFVDPVAFICELLSSKVFIFVSGDCACEILCLSHDAVVLDVDMLCTV
jgi:hypothetical protein